MKQHSTYNLASIKKQQGLTALETIGAILAGFAALIGAGALIYLAFSAVNTTGGVTDINQIKQSMQALQQGQGSYGTTVLNGVLAVSQKLPADLTTSGTGTSTTITTPNNGAITVTGTGANFTIALTNQPADQCTSFLTSSQSGWKQISVNGGTAITTFPISSTVATGSNACGGTAPFTITWTTLN